MKYAVIDIGTNSTRLYIAEVNGKTSSTVLKKLKTTRIGEGMASADKAGHKPVLGVEPMDRTSECILDFSLEARRLGVPKENIFIYATAAVREASNKEEFKNSVFEKTGIELDIISGKIEALIAYLGAAENRDGYAVIDIGGGSTEVVTLKGNRICGVSERIGGVRLKEMFDSSDGRVDTDAVKDYALKNFVPDYSPIIKGCRGLIGVSGTPTTIASLVMGLKTYIPERVQDARLSLGELNNELKALAAMTLDERKEYSGDFATRADIITYGGCVLSAFMEYYGISEIVTSDRDSLEGYLNYKLKTPNGG